MAKITLKAFSSFRRAKSAFSDRFYEKGIKINFSSMSIVYPNKDIEYYKVFEHSSDVDRVRGLRLTNYQVDGEIPNICLEAIIASIR